MRIFRRTASSSTDKQSQRGRSSLDDRPAWMLDGMSAVLVKGPEDLEVVGESQYQENLWQLAGGRGRPEERVRIDIVAVLVAELDNPYDSNAISIWIDGLKVGYLSLDDARQHRPG